MAKVYSKVNWGTNTQVGFEPLDKMDTGIDAIDNKVHTLEVDSGWIQLGTANHGIKLRKKGNLVTITGVSSVIPFGGTGGYVDIVQIPEWAKPSLVLTFPIGASGGDASRMVGKIEPMSGTNPGYLQLYSPTATTYYNFTVTYIY